jgi:hypothetical protein
MRGRVASQWTIAFFHSDRDWPLATVGKSIPAMRRHSPRLQRSVRITAIVLCTLYSPVVMRVLPMDVIAGHSGHTPPHIDPRTHASSTLKPAQKTLQK